MKPTLLILAAGMGSRYGGLKQLDGFGPGGETILEYSVYDAIRAGFGKVVFVIRSEFRQAFQEKIGNRLAAHIEVAYVYQENTSFVPKGFSVDHRLSPWGTGHAVLVAKDAITTPFAVINADDYYGISGYASMARFLQEEVSPSVCGMIGYTLENTLSPNGTVNRGVCRTNDAQCLISINERHKLERRDDGHIWDMHDRMLDGNSTVSLTFQGFHPSVFGIIESLFLAFLEQNGQDPSFEFYITSIVNHFIHTQKNICKVLPSNDQWSGVTYIEDKVHTEHLLTTLTKNGAYPTPLWS